jgi:PAS domain S-box-containing protein
MTQTYRGEGPHRRENGACRVCPAGVSTPASSPRRHRPRRPTVPVRPRGPRPVPPQDSDRDRLARALTRLAAGEVELEQERRHRVETRALFDLVLRAVSDAVIFVDAGGHVVHMNEAATRLTGYVAANLVGRTVDSIFGAGVPAIPREVSEGTPGGQIQSFEGSIVSPDQQIVPVTVSCSVLHDERGKVVGALYAARDLSETQHLVRQLEDAEARWRLLAELDDLLGQEVDPKESLPETCRLLSTATGSGVAMIVSDGLAIDRVAAWPSDGPVAVELAAMASRPLERESALWTALREPRTVHASTLYADFPLLRPSGVPGLIRSAALVPLIARNTRLGALFVHSSQPGAVTDRMLTLVEEAGARVALAIANAQLREALAHLEVSQEAARFREDLLAAVSHDMQTPLAILLGSLKALRSGDISSKHRAELYEGMERRGTQLRRLVQQFLDFSRLEAGHPIVIRPYLTDVAAAIAQVEDDVWGRRPVQVHLPEDLPPAYVDPDRLDQVLANLVSNAVKFSPPGSPMTLVARATEDTVEIVVADRGQGMSPADLAHVFEKFYRGSGAEGIPGTGLGLYVSRALLEAHGGRITVTSRPGHGSQFTVVLPRRPPPAPATDTTTPPA